MSAQCDLAIGLNPPNTHSSIPKDCQNALAIGAENSAAAGVASFVRYAYWMSVGGIPESRATRGAPKLRSIGACCCYNALAIWTEAGAPTFPRRRAAGNYDCGASRKVPNACREIGRASCRERE